jgi:hypothetical protein
MKLNLAAPLKSPAQPLARLDCLRDEVGLAAPAQRGHPEDDLAESQYYPNKRWVKYRITVYAVVLAKFAMICESHRAQKPEPVCILSMG